jgi:hypothetical protein
MQVQLFYELRLQLMAVFSRVWGNFVLNCDEPEKSVLL